MKDSKYRTLILDTVRDGLDADRRLDDPPVEVSFMDRTSDCVTDYLNDQLTVTIGDETFHVTVERITD